jgi:hypothetical protein
MVEKRYLSTRFATTNSAGVQNMALRSKARMFQNRTVYLKHKQKHGEMQIDAEVALAPQTEDAVNAARR